MDGFLAKFYSRFWGLLGRNLVETLNFSFSEGFLSASQDQGILRLLFKKDDPLSLKNWRPISLLNLDYKIATKALLNHIRKVLPNILSEDQTCGVPGRSIFENLFLLRDFGISLTINNCRQLSSALTKKRLLIELTTISCNVSSRNLILALISAAGLKLFTQISRPWLSTMAGFPRLFHSSEGLDKAVRFPRCYIASWLKP